MADIFFQPDAINFNPDGFDRGNGLRVQFMMMPVKDMEASTKEGRPVYRNVEHVKIQVVGEHDEIVRIARKEDKAKFSRAYLYFKETQEAQPDGMPLEKWPLLDAAQVLELKAMKIHTVEQLAEQKDTPHRFLDELGEKARQYLDYSKDGAALTKAMAEIDDQKAEIRRLQEKVRKLEAAAKAGKDKADE